MNKKRGPQGLILFAKRSLRPVFWMPLLSFATLGVLLAQPTRLVSAGYLQYPTQPNSNHSEAQSVASPNETQPTPQATAQPTTSPSAPQAQSIAAVAPASPYCKVAIFGAPSIISAESSVTGVTVVTDPPVYYSFRGGNTNSATIARATSCARQQPAFNGKYYALIVCIVKYVYDIIFIDSVICCVNVVRVIFY